MNKIESEIREAVDSLPCDLKRVAWRYVFPWFVDKTMTEREGGVVYSFHDWLTRFALRGTVVPKEASK